MPAIKSILAALALAIQRELGGFRAFRVNNFFLVIVLIVYGALESGVWPTAAEPLVLFMGVLMLFPLSADPLDFLPRSRLMLFPLTRRQQAALRLVSLLLSPMFWLAVAVLAATRRFGMAAFIVVLATASRLLGAGTSRPLRFVWRLVPPLPGRLGGLVRHALRQMVVTLDFWLALLLAVGGTVYRFSGEASAESLPVIAMFVGVALSTYGQCLFGMDRWAAGPMTRYELLPVGGWVVLLAHDLAFLVVLLVLTLALDPLAGMTFGLTALAVGHHASVFVRDRLAPWRFSGSRVLPAAVQGILSLMLGFGEVQRGPVFVLVAAGLWAVSVAVYGRFVSRSR